MDVTDITPVGSLLIPTSLPFVLQVEDSDEDVQLLHEAFRELRIAVRFMTVSTPSQALGVLRLLPTYGLPSLILIDLGLPIASGHELLRHFTRDPHWRSIPMVVLTSSLDDLDRTTSLALGAVEHLLKPTQYSGYVAQATHLSRYLGAEGHPN